MWFQFRFRSRFSSVWGAVLREPGGGVRLLPYVSGDWPRHRLRLQLLPVCVDQGVHHGRPPGGRPHLLQRHRVQTTSATEVRARHSRTVITPGGASSGIQSMEVYILIFLTALVPKPLIGTERKLNRTVRRALESCSQYICQTNLHIFGNNFIPYLYERAYRYQFIQ